MNCRTLKLLALLCLGGLPALSPGPLLAAKGGKGPKALAPGGTTASFVLRDETKVHEDFPVLTIDSEGRRVTAFVKFDGGKDTLVVLRDSGRNATLVREGGDILQPAVASAKTGETWIFWSELMKGHWNLRARKLAAKGNGLSPIVDLASASGNNVFADAGTDRKGRIWVAWQRLDGGHGDIFARWLAPGSKNWSDEMRVTRHKAGDWEPRLAFGRKDEALILFDSYRNGDFDLFLARVVPGGKTDITPVAATPRYEARASAAVSRDGNTLWVAYENGVERWGKDLGSEWRKIGGGLNYDRRIKLAKVDLDSLEITFVSDVTPLIPGMVSTPGKSDTGAVNLPSIAVDAHDQPWLFFRYSPQKGVGYWQIAYSCLDPGSGQWTEAKTLQNSAYCQDRRCSISATRDGVIHAVWPSDKRRSKQQADTGIHAARILPDEAGGKSSRHTLPFEIAGVPESPLKPYNSTPEREREERHVWKTGGKRLELYWGDVHRHTDFSNCRTTDDGCIVEHFRYALDAGGLDYLATSDHTEVGKTLSAYEWWQTQKLADVFQNPGFFLSFYAYEREQKWPYGHRNVVFLERGGPIIYIKRDNYARSQWATPLPPADGVREGEIPPWQLWKLLRAHGQRAVTIEHTSAGGMGTDWAVYDKIDTEFENIIELFQGSRESYEGVGAPQPPIVGGKSRQFGKFNAGTWQNALSRGHKLGAFASSDHRSTHISYGGVYVESFDRKGVFDAMDARRTIAATDKIFMEFSCNGRPLGAEFTARKNPALTLAVAGTAPIKRVTIIRNEEDYKVFEPNSAHFAQEFTDPNPVSGENRYYIRVEQSDGNMGWTSPIWVTYKPQP